MPLDLPPDCSRLVAETRAWPAAPEDMKAFVAKLSERWECERLRDAGWAKLENVAKAERQVRRANFYDGRFAFRIPAVALEQDRDGAVVLRVSMARPQTIVSVAVPKEEWRALTAQDAAIRPAPPSPPSSEPGLPTIPRFHCAPAKVEVADGRIESWTRQLSECGLQDADGLAYAYELARIAVTYAPTCAKEKAWLEAERSSGKGPEAAVDALERCGGVFQPRTLPVG